MVEKPPRNLMLPIKEEGGRLFLTITPEIKNRYNLEEIRSNMLDLGVGNMRLDRIKLAIEKSSGQPEDIGPVFTYFDRDKEKYITVLVADDEEWALMDVTNSSAADISADDLRFCLYKAGVVDGIKEGVLADLASKKEIIKEVIVAQANPPIDGADAQIEYFVNVSSKPKPRILPDGSVDPKSFDLILAVDKDQVLARKVPVKPGIPGATVRGRPIPAKQGEDIVLTASKGTYVSEDGLELRAITDGSVQRDRKGVLYVEEAYNIRGNLGYSTGNVNCAGDVKVGGDVLSGFSLIATGDVVINGVIEGAKVISKSGSVMVKGGIHGQQNQAYIEAKETVAARFVQEATIISGDTVMISGHILDSTIKAARIVDVSSKHGSVMNSLVQAAEEIIVRNLGGPGSKGTEARISDLETNATEIRENIQRLGRTIAALEDKVGRLKDVVDTLSKTGGRAIMKGSGIKNYVERIVKENDNLSKVMDERAELRKLLAKLLCGRITIIDTLYPGCKITIAGLSETINDPIRKLVYTVEKGELVARPYSPSS